MKKAKTIFFLGIWVAILPYLGFPFFIKNILISLSGFALIGIGYLTFKALSMNKDKKEKVYENFSENKNFLDKNLPEKNNEFSSQEEDLVNS